MKAKSQGKSKTNGHVDGRNLSQEQRISKHIINQEKRECNKLPRKWTDQTPSVTWLVENESASLKNNRQATMFKCTRPPIIIYRSFRQISQMSTGPATVFLHAQSRNPAGALPLPVCGCRLPSCRPRLGGRRSGWCSWRCWISPEGPETRSPPGCCYGC